MKLTPEIKQQFTKIIPATSIHLDVKYISQFNKKFKSYIFRNAKWSITQQQNIKSLTINKLPPFDDEFQSFINETNAQTQPYEAQQTYDDLTYNEILEQLLPIMPPQGFEMIGKIAHFNLAPEQLQYKYIIGQVLLDKNKNLETVCNKTEKLHNVYRTPQLELLAGKDSYEAMVPEGGVKLFLNFEKVYWCTRLYSERERIIKLIKELSGGQQIKILDLFCGIGPFSLRIAKELNAQCLANDLNPECYVYLQKNIAENKLQLQVIPYNLDAREVVLKIYNKEIDFHFNHVYMNLPVLAINFLDVFRGFTQKTQRTDLPYIHVYGFAKGINDEELIQQFTQRIKQSLPGFDPSKILKFHVLKNVTKLKKMCCLSFKLDQESAESEFQLNEQQEQNESDFEDDGQEQLELQEQIQRKKVKLN